MPVRDDPGVQLPFQASTPTVPGEVSTGDLPTREAVRELLAQAHRSYADVDEGEVATTSPRWRAPRPTSSGSRSSACGADSETVGDATEPFTIQSVAKPFAFALVCEALGHRAARERPRRQRHRAAVRLGDGGRDVRPTA